MTTVRGEGAGEVTIHREEPNTADVRRLIAGLDAAIEERHPGGVIHGLNPEEARAFPGVFLVARAGGRAVGCGALRPLEPGTGEVKRMYVEPEYRGRGIARRLLRELEGAARERGIHTLRVETGDRLTEAMRLYESEGYAPIPVYGEYARNPFSRCFEKRLSGVPGE